MLQGETDVRAVQTVGIVAVGLVHMLGLVERFAERGTHEVFVAQLCRDGGAAERPVEI